MYDLDWKEFAVLNKPGFKVIGFDGEEWTRIHNGERATTPYMNKHRWYLGITDYHIAEYISLKSKVDYWKTRKKRNDFDPIKFDQYKDSLNHLLDGLEDRIYEDLSSNKYSELSHFLPKSVQDIFVF